MAIGAIIAGIIGAYFSGYFQAPVNDSNYSVVRGWGSSGSENGQFITPWGVAVDPSGNVYVADNQNNRVQKFTSDGKFITKWGSVGSGDGQFTNPQGVAVDSSGNVFVTDVGNNRVQKFTSDGKFITKWRAGQVSYPGGVAVDHSGQVYASMHVSDLMQVYG